MRELKLIMIAHLNVLPPREITINNQFITNILSCIKKNLHLVLHFPENKIKNDLLLLCILHLKYMHAYTL